MHSFLPTSSFLSALYGIVLAPGCLFVSHERQLENLVQYRFERRPLELEFLSMKPVTKKMQFHLRVLSKKTASRPSDFSLPVDPTSPLLRKMTRRPAMQQPCPFPFCPPSHDSPYGNLTKHPAMQPSRTPPSPSEAPKRNLKRGDSGQQREYLRTPHGAAAAAAAVKQKGQNATNSLSLSHPPSCCSHP